MIKLEPIEPPRELTQELVAQLTEQFRQDQHLAVWKKSFIITALAKLSNEKCCYCECKLGEECKYLEVEHFHHKNQYKEEVVAWNNLLPACANCNRTKGSFDTRQTPIIHPVKINPKDHLYFAHFSIKGKTNLGKATVEVLRLNDFKKILTKRFKLGNGILQKLEEINDWNGDLDSPIKARKIINKLAAIMETGCPDSEYTATISTLILNDSNYKNIREALKEKELWNDELENLERDLIKYSFEITI